MSEPKYRYRIPPCEPYDIPAMESWLEDQSARGLHLAMDGFFMGFATFEEGPPRREKFRLEPTATAKGLLSEEYEPDGDAVQLHQQMGWVYRARRDQFHIYSSADPDAPELNTDPQVQAITMAALTRYLRKSLINSLILIGFYLLLCFGDLLISGAIVLGTWRVLLFAGLMVWDLGRQIRALAVLSGYRRQLQQGEALPHRSDYRRLGRSYLIGGAVRRVLWVVLAVSLAVHLIPHLCGEDEISLDDYGEPFPFATMADLYPDAAVDRTSGLLSSQTVVWSDVLSPENHDFSELARVTQDGQTLDCYLTVSYHRTRWEWTARMLAQELVSQAGGNPLDQALDRLWGEEALAVTQLTVPGADYAVSYFLNRDEPTLVLQKGNIVLRVNLDVLGGRHGFEPEALAELLLSHLR